jgi:hypothetical protein
LRRQTDQAEQSEAVAPGTSPVAAPARKKNAATRKAAAPRANRPRKQKVKPRMRARWGVFDGSMKQVAIFDFNQRAAALDKLTDLHEKKKGIHFLQIVKEPMPEPLPAEAPAVP